MRLQRDSKVRAAYPVIINSPRPTVKSDQRSDGRVTPLSQPLSLLKIPSGVKRAIQAYCDVFMGHPILIDRSFVAENGELLTEGEIFQNQQRTVLEEGTKHRRMTRRMDTGTSPPIVMHNPWGLP